VGKLEEDDIEYKIIPDVDREPVIQPFTKAAESNDRSLLCPKK